MIFKLGNWENKISLCEFFISLTHLSWTYLGKKNWRDSRSRLGFETKGAETLGLVSVLLHFWLLISQGLGLVRLLIFPEVSGLVLSKIIGNWINLLRSRHVLVLRHETLGLVPVSFHFWFLKRLSLVLVHWIHFPDISLLVSLKILVSQISDKFTFLTFSALETIYIILYFLWPPCYVGRGQQ